MPIRKAATAMVRQLLTPVVRLLIELGIDHKTFADTAKRVYVDVAAREYGVRGRPTNSARIAMLTGINRRDVARIREEPVLAAAELLDESSALARILAGWHQSPEFVDAAGAPRALRRGAELDALLTRFGGDVPPTALLKELLRVEAIAFDDSDVARPRTRYYLPFELDEHSVLRYGSVLADLASTINHNLLATDRAQARFEGRAVNPTVARRAYPAFRALVDAEGEAFLERIDAWLTEHEADADAPHLRLGVGLFLIASPDSAEERS